MIIVRILVNPIFNSLFVIKSKMFVRCHSLAPNVSVVEKVGEQRATSLSHVKLIIKIEKET